MKKLLQLVVLMLLLTVLSYGQGQAPPTGFVQPVALSGQQTNGIFAYLGLDSSGNLLTSGSTGIRAQIGGFVPPSAVVAQDSAGNWHYLKVDSSGNLLVTSSGTCAGCATISGSPANVQIAQWVSGTALQGKSWGDLDSSQYVAATGSAQAQVVTLASPVTALVPGLEINFLPVANNTLAAPTLAVNGLTAKPITKGGTTALVANDLTTTAIASVIYDGTQFQLQNPQTSPTSSTLTANGQSCVLGSTCNVNVGAGAHTVSINEGNGSAIGGAGPGTTNMLFASAGNSADPTYKSWADLTSTQYMAATGTAQAQVVTLAPPATSLVAGLEINFLPVANNSGAAPTLAVNGLTAKPITKSGTTALIANDLVTTAIASVIYDGTEFILQNPQTIAPLTTAGDTLYMNSTPAMARLPIGGNGQFLFVNSTVPGWDSNITDITGLLSYSGVNGLSTVGLVAAGGGVSSNGSPGAGRFSCGQGADPFPITGNMVEIVCPIVSGTLYQIVEPNTSATGFVYSTNVTQATAGTITFSGGGIATIPLNSGGTYPAGMYPGSGAGPACAIAGNGANATCTTTMNGAGTAVASFNVGAAGTGYTSATASVPVQSFWSYHTIVAGDLVPCTTCVTSAASLTSTALMTGAGAQASQTPSNTSTLSAAGVLAVAAGGSVGSADTGTPKFTFSASLITANQPVAFTSTTRSSGVLPYWQLTIPTDTGLTAATEAPGLQTVTGTRTWATTGTVATQREFLFVAPTYASASASQTFTKAATLAVSGAPIAGTNAIITNPFAFWVQSGSTELDEGTNATATNIPALAVTETWNNASIAGPAFSVAVTVTSSSATALLGQFLGGAGGATSEWQVDKGGTSQQQGSVRTINTGLIGFNSGGINTAVATNINEVASGLLGVGTTAANTLGFIKTAQFIAVTGADVTCGTGGTLTPCTALTTITGLTATLPLVAANWSFDCTIYYSQATAAAADQIGVQTATNGATNLTAGADAFTAAAVIGDGVITDVASTTTAQSVITFTPGGTGSKQKIHLTGTIEGASASGTVFNVLGLTGAAADLLTFYRGSGCWVW
jgi:hypothetical protein